MQNEQENSSQVQDKKLNFSEQYFRKFVENFSEYLANANESKKRGNNDYNPLKAVQSPYDEVNMHSGFLVSFLNPRGEHYQDDLFLRLFLKILQLDKWFGSTKNARVFKEKKNIDIHISNGEKHIIIENKLEAPDQPNQIAKYIESIHRPNSKDIEVEYENNQTNETNICVIYLTLYDKHPSENSRTRKEDSLIWEIQGDYLQSSEGKVGYKRIFYKDIILEWIESCQKEVGNIVNLNSALEFYKDIVEIITYQRESKMVKIAEFFKNEKDFEVAFEISKNEDEIMRAYIANIADNIKSNIDDGWELNLDKNDDYFIMWNKQCGDDAGFLFDLEWYGKQFSCWLYLYGIKKLVENYNEKNMETYRQELQKHLSQELENKKGVNNKLCICAAYKKIDNPLDAKKEFLDFVEKYTDLADKLNEKLKTFKI